AVFIASLVACNLIFQKFFHWTLTVRLFDWTLIHYTFELSVGILPYPITFLVTDIVSEIYGKRRADQIVVSGFIASIFVMLIVLLAQA
ncbi:MAG: VUT family protein, partial [Candidatus Hinthialibacter sp.]